MVLTVPVEPCGIETTIRQVDYNRGWLYHEPGATYFMMGERNEAEALWEICEECGV